MESLTLLECQRNSSVERNLWNSEPVEKKITKSSELSRTS